MKKSIFSQTNDTQGTAVTVRMVSREANEGTVRKMRNTAPPERQLLQSWPATKWMSGPVSNAIVQSGILLNLANRARVTNSVIMKVDAIDGIDAIAGLTTCSRADTSTCSTPR